MVFIINSTKLIMQLMCTIKGRPYYEILTRDEDRSEITRKDETVLFRNSLLEKRIQSWYKLRGQDRPRRIQRGLDWYKRVHGGLEALSVFPEKKPLNHSCVPEHHTNCSIHRTSIYVYIWTRTRVCCTGARAHKICALVSRERAPAIGRDKRDTGPKSLGHSIHLFPSRDLCYIYKYIRIKCTVTRSNHRSFLCHDDSPSFRANAFSKGCEKKISIATGDKLFWHLTNFDSVIILFSHTLPQRKMYWDE